MHAIRQRATPPKGAELIENYVGSNPVMDYM